MLTDNQFINTINNYVETSIDYGTAFHTTGIDKAREVSLLKAIILSVLPIQASRIN